MGKGCAGEFCHGAGAGSLSMDNKADAYMNLVGKAAAGEKCGSTALTRVKAGDPDASLLLQKMTGPMPPCGDLMPIGVRFEPDCLSPSASVCTKASELQLVRDWIAAGALND